MKKNTLVYAFYLSFIQMAVVALFWTTMAQAGQPARKPSQDAAKASAVSALQHLKATCSPYEVRIFTSYNWCIACNKLNDQLYAVTKDMRASFGKSKCGYEQELIYEVDGELFAVRVTKVDVANTNFQEGKELGMAGRYIPELQVRVDNPKIKSQDASELLDYRTGQFQMDYLKTFIQQTAQKHEKARREKSVASK